MARGGFENVAHSPDLFRRLITYSGTFVDQQDDDAPEEAKFPLGAGRPEASYHNWVMANERPAAALKAKGYDHRFVFSRDARHCDRRVFEATLADTLVWMWRGYHADE